jgi:hypothetical protein|tara:strand:+ start:2281 stop:2409 length:129 start_codon:yes stop_codon:yes gene_type:complete
MMKNEAKIITIFLSLNAAMISIVVSLYAKAGVNINALLDYLR